MALVTFKQRSVAHRTYQAVGWAILAVIALSIPHIADPKSPAKFGKVIFQVGIFNKVLVYAVAILAVNLVTGFTGQLSLGHGAFVGLGAYTSVLLVANRHWSYFTTIPFAMAVGLVIGLLIGLPALRIRGLYLAIVTTALAVIFPTIILKFESVTGGSNGKKPCWKSGTSTKSACHKLLPPDWAQSVFGLRTKGDDARWTYYVLLLMTIACFVVVRNLVRGRVGRAMIAIRDRETSAATSGVNTKVYKVITFGVSGAIGAVAGVMYLMQFQFVSDVDFNAAFSLYLIVGIVAGGVASIGGNLLGALLVVLLPHITSSFIGSGAKPKIEASNLVKIVEYYVLKQPTVLFGIILLVLVFVMPLGLTDGLRRLRYRIVQIVPNPAWLPDAKVAAAAERTLGERNAVVAAKSVAADRGLTTGLDPNPGGI